jgi:hypothetical protein
MSERPGAVIQSLLCVVFRQQNLFFCKREYLYAIFDKLESDPLSVINEAESAEMTREDAAYP